MRAYSVDLREREVIELLNHRITRMKVLTRDVNTSALARDQHQEIVAALAAHDEDRAESVMRNHVRANLEIICERIRRAEGSDATSSAELQGSHVSSRSPRFE